MEKPELDRCLKRTQEGDEGAARELFTFLYPVVMRLVRSHLPLRTSPEDLAQMALIKIFTHLGQYAESVPLEHWVSRIVINTCLNQIRAEKARPELRMSDLSEEQAMVLEQVVTQDLPTEMSGAAREVIDLLLARLSPDDRLLITLLHIEERSVAEVASMTGWSRVAVKVKAFRARARMRGHLADLRKKGHDL